MVISEEVLKKIAEWSKGYTPDKITRIDKKIAHKTNEQNVFLSRVEKLNSDDTDSFLTQIVIDTKHPYFFEHEYDHVPGMMIIEAGRQVGVAIAHLHYDVTHDKAFILNELNIRFSKYVEVHKPLFAYSRVSNIKYRKGELLKMMHEGYFIQSDEIVAYMGGMWQMYDKKIVERFRSPEKKS
ncbi:MAG: hypothetical protein KAT34_05410 [Candidatus Aminicenantes bacterium]|nr:hypothetical protein [Candidatus Aminicenantes bacterium]